MSGDLCTLWEAFVTREEHADVTARVRDVANQLLDHVEECDACAAVAASADSAGVYERLAALGDVSPPADEAIESMLSARVSDRQAIERAVEEVLLPSLPPRLAALASLGGDVTPRTLFLSLDAVRMMLKRRLRSRLAAAQRTLAMRSDGTVVLNTDVLVPSEAVVAEIAQYAGLGDRSARSVVEWIPAAAASQPQLIPGVDSDSQGRRDGMWLKMVPWDATAGDLFERWKVPTAKPERPRPGVRPVRRPAGIQPAKV